jgi:hypothetical protein
MTRQAPFRAVTNAVAIATAFGMIVFLTVWHGGAP